MMSVLFPDSRYVLTWSAVGFLLLLVLAAMDGADAVLLCATAVSAFWAWDCLQRLRRWQAGVLVPGYASTSLVVAAGIVGGVATLATAVSYLAGNTAPAFGMATMVGAIFLLGLTYAYQTSAIRRALPILANIAVVGLIARIHFGGPIAWPEMAHPLIQWLALAVAVAAIVLLKNQLDQPARPQHENPARPWRHFRPFVAGPKDVFGGWMSRKRVAEGFFVVTPFIFTMQIYDAFDSIPSLVTVVLFYAIYVGSLTPVLLLKGAGMWMSTAWQLGAADSRPGIGRMYGSRIVAATLATLPPVLVAVAGHALFVPSETLRAGHRDLIDETLLLYAVGFAAFAWACYIHPPRTTTTTQVAATGVACVVYLVLFHAAPTFQAGGRAVLLLLLVASAAVAVHVGGRAIARIDFLPTTDD